MEIKMLNSFVEPPALTASTSIAVVRLSNTTVQVSSASLQFRVRLSGVVAFMTWWPLSAAIIGISLIWAVMICTSGFLLLVRVSYYA